MNIKRGEIYYADLSPVIGSEQGGIRPVLIVQNDVGNKHSPTTIVAPLTTQIKHKLPTHFDVQMPNGKKSTVLMEQLRVIDKTRIQGKPIGVLRNWENANRAMMISLGIAAN